MSWSELEEPLYQIDVRVEGITVTVEYDVEGQNTMDTIWDEVKDVSEIHVRRIIHKGENIKRLVRGYGAKMVQDAVFRNHNK